MHKPSRVNLESSGDDGFNPMAICTSSSIAVSIVHDVFDELVCSGTSSSSFTLSEKSEPILMDGQTSSSSKREPIETPPLPVIIVSYIYVNVTH